MNRVISVRVFLLLLLSLFLNAAAYADGVEWDSLSEDQKALLSAQQEGWDTLDAARQERLARGAERWLGMDARERSAARERFCVLQMSSTGFDGSVEISPRRAASCGLSGSSVRIRLLNGPMNKEISVLKFAAVWIWRWRQLS